MTSFVRLVVLCSLVACGSAAPAQPVVNRALIATAPVIEAKLDATTVMARMQQAYATAKTYSSSGRYASINADGDAWFWVESTTTFVRDHRLHVAGTSNDNAVHRFALWSDFSHTYSSEERPNHREARDDGMRLRDALSPFWPWDDAIWLLLPDPDLKYQPMDPSEDGTLTEDRIDDHDCWLVSGKRGTTAVNIWLDRDTFLIRKIVTRWASGDSYDERVTTMDPILDAPISATSAPPLDLAASPPRRPKLPDAELGLVVDDHEVRGVNPDGPAARAGIALGDSILAVDGARNYDDAKLSSGVMSKPAGTTFKLTVSHAGSERDVTLVSETPPRDLAAYQAKLMHDQPAPPFDLPVIAGPNRGRLADLQGKVVLLAFWSSPCKECLDSLTALQELAKRHPEVSIVAISSEATDVIAKEAAARGTPFTFAHDPGGAVSSQYSVWMRTHVVLIDQQGIVRFVELDPRADSAIGLYVGLLLRR